MLGSVNFERLIYKAEGVNASAGSVTIQKLYETLFLQRNISYNYTEFNGRSDYGPFLAEHIAAGGLFSGAEEIKDFDGRKQFGGINNVQLDPCYHQACDTLQNIDFDVSSHTHTHTHTHTQTQTLICAIASILSLR